MNTPRTKGFIESLYMVLKGYRVPVKGICLECKINYFKRCFEKSGLTTADIERAIESISGVE